MNRRLLETFLTVESGIREQAVLLLPKSQQASVPKLLCVMTNWCLSHIQLGCVLLSDRDSGKLFLGSHISEKLKIFLSMI